MIWLRVFSDWFLANPKVIKAESASSTAWFLWFHFDRQRLPLRFQDFVLQFEDNPLGGFSPTPVLAWMPVHSQLKWRSCIPQSCQIIPAGRIRTYTRNGNKVKIHLGRILESPQAMCIFLTWSQVKIFSWHFRRSDRRREGDAYSRCRRLQDDVGWRETTFPWM